MSSTQVKDEFLHMDERISSIYDGDYFRVMQQKGDILIVSNDGFVSVFVCEWSVAPSQFSKLFCFFHQIHQVQCITCGPDAPQLRASRRSNGNILKHIQRRHSELLSKIRIEKNIKCRAPGLRRSAIKSEAATKTFMETVHSTPAKTTLTNEAKARMHFVEASTPDSIENFQYLDRTECSNEENMQLLQTDDNLISEEQEAADYISHENLNDIGTDDEQTHKHLHLKADHIECDDYEECPETVSSDDVKMRQQVSKEVMELKKELMLREFDELQEMRREKHRFEIEILRRELEFKKIEHRKKIELLEKQLREK